MYIHIHISTPYPDFSAACDWFHFRAHAVREIIKFIFCVCHTRRIKAKIRSLWLKYYISTIQSSKAKGIFSFNRSLAHSLASVSSTSYLWLFYFVEFLSSLNMAKAHFNYFSWDEVWTTTHIMHKYVNMDEVERTGVGHRVADRAVLIRITMDERCRRSFFGCCYCRWPGPAENLYFMFCRERRWGSRGCLKRWPKYRKQFQKCSEYV